jgi:hypothetical protein
MPNKWINFWKLALFIGFMAGAILGVVLLQIKANTCLTQVLR